MFERTGIRKPVKAGENKREIKVNERNVKRMTFLEDNGYL